jgi:hypothetical protein
VIPLLLRLQLLESRRLRSLLLALLPPVSYGQRRPSCLFEAAWPSGSAWRGRRALPRGLWGRPHRRLAGAAHPTRPQRVPRRFRLACSLPLARGGPGFRRRGPGARRRRRLRAARGRGDLVRCPLLAAVPRLPPLLLRPCPPPSRGRVRVSEALPFRACLSPPAADPLPLSLPLSASLSPPAADPLVPLSLPLSASLSPPAADPLPLSLPLSASISPPAADPLPSRGRVRVSEARVPPSSFCGRVRLSPAAVSASLRPVCLPPPSAAVSASLPRPCPRL